MCETKLMVTSYFFCGIIFIFTGILFLLRPNIGIIFYLALYFFIPKLPFNLGYYVLNIAITLFFVFPKFKLISIRYFPLRIIYIYYLFLFLMIPFQNCPISYQVPQWINSVLKTSVILVIITIYLNSKFSRLVNLNITVLFFTSLICLYAIWLIQYKQGENPWLMFFWHEEYTNLLHNQVSWITASDRPFGRIFSVFIHPMLFGAFIVCSFFFCLFLFLDISQKKIIKIISFILLLLLLFCSILCGARSCLFSLLGGLLLFVIYNHKIFSFRFYLISIIFLICFAITKASYLLSFFDYTSDNVAGSSLLMRFNQLKGCFIVLDDVFWGNGYNWAFFYVKNYGDHPLLLCFESKIFLILCNSGILGFLGWIIFLIFMHRYQTKLYKFGFDRYRILICLFWSFQLYVCSTGDYGFTFIWMIFYALLIINIRSLSSATLAKCVN